MAQYGNMGGTPEYLYDIIMLASCCLRVWLEKKMK